MTVSLVAAVARNAVIGRDNKIPWRLPDDMRFFKQLTTGHTIVMGRKTFESIGKPLPDRHNIVLSQRANFRPDGVTVARSIERALAESAPDRDVFVVGGAEVYRIAMPLADKIFLTRVETEVAGDVFFPPMVPADWTLVSSQPHAADDRHAVAFAFETYERVDGR